MTERDESDDKKISWADALQQIITELNEEMIEGLYSYNIPPQVLLAMRGVNRAAFVPLHILYTPVFANRAIQIIPEIGVSLSEPLLVAQMLQALQVEAGQKVLEIGAGMGYQAAILSHLVGREGKVVAVEIHPRFAEISRQLIQNVDCSNVQVVCGDGWNGHEQEAPYDRVIVTATAPSMPDALYNQLKPGGIMVVPIGLPNQAQILTRIVKGETPQTTSLFQVSFHPMVRGERK